MRAVGAILIGGSSRRMGTDKALAEVGGRPLHAWVGRALEEAGLDVVTVGGPHRIHDHPHLGDVPGMYGPLAGLAAALDYADGRPVVVAAVDQPLLRSATIRRLIAIDTDDAVVPYANEIPQVMCALYRYSCRPAIDALRTTNPNAAMRDLLTVVAVRRVPPAEWASWGEDGRSWRSVDTPQALTAVRAVLAGDQAAAEELPSPQEET